jgi:hypothetical protein
MAFTLYHADQMPKVAIQSAEVKPAAGGLFEVTAAVANLRLTPTRAAVDVKHGITPPDVVSIEGKDIEVILGLTCDDRFFRDARDQKYQPDRLRLDRIPGMGAAHVRWFVRGKGPYTITVRSIKGGSDVKTVARQSRNQRRGGKGSGVFSATELSMRKAGRPKRLPTPFAPTAFARGARNSIVYSVE